ncbi:MAG: FKBP-type peptidyl-prolyl cis-trans isomerase [Bacteroidota bacterium]|nr:FKBP-type peptidyl-prolyl cis-trans isomerase [Bacteroidota bacterium]
MNKLFLFSSAVVAIAFTACKGGDGSAFDGYTRTETGLHYKFFKHTEDSATAKDGDGVVFGYVIKTEKNDSLIVDSKTQSQDGSGYTRFLLKKSSFVGSLEDGMKLMAKGDSASFIIPADSFFLKTMGMNELPASVAKGSFLKATIVMKDILSSKQIEENQKKQMAEREAMMKEAEAKEKVTFDAYITENKITAKPTESGLIFVETKKGNGKHPKATDEVTVHYTGTLMDGTKFDSSLDRGEPAKFPLNQVIPGWTEGIQLMSKGSKGKLIIPSKLGYGPQGAGGKIPPFAPLVFEVELLDFHEAPPQQQMQMPEQHGPNDGHNH